MLYLPTIQLFYLPNKFTYLPSNIPTYQMPKFHLHVPIERVYVLVDKGNLSFARDDDDGGGVGVVITQSESVSVCEMKRLLDKSSSTAPDARHHFCLGASPPFREREGVVFPPFALELARNMFHYRGTIFLPLSSDDDENEPNVNSGVRSSRKIRLMKNCDPII